MLFRNLFNHICDYWGAYLLLLATIVFFVFILVGANKHHKRADARRKAQEEVFYMQNPEALRLKRIEDSLYNQYLKEQ